MQSFNLQKSYASFCEDIGIASTNSGLTTLEFKGQDPVLPTKLRFGSIYGIPAAATAAQVADIWKIRTGETQNVEVDIEQAAHMVADIPYSTLNGEPYHTRFALVPGKYKTPYVLQFFPTKDHKLFVPVGFYPNMERKWSEFLGVLATHEAVAEAIKKWNAEDLQEACNKVGLVGSYVRTKEEWYATDAGKALMEQPVAKITKIAEGEPIAWSENPKRPLSGIKVLGDTHEIAGPIIARSLAGQGADSLQVTDPMEYWHQSVYLQCAQGVRQASIDLSKEEDKATFHALAKEADVFVENYRTTGKTAQENFTPEVLTKNHKGLIYVKVHGISYDGMPWTDRGCFDPLAIPMTGVAALEGTVEEPKFPVGDFLCDNMTGLIAVPAVLEALKRRATEGGSYMVEVSLAKTAMWAMDLGTFDKTPEDLPKVEIKKMKIEGNLGTMIRPASAVKYSSTEDQWEQGISYRGADKAEWL